MPSALRNRKAAGLLLLAFSLLALLFICFFDAGRPFSAYCVEDGAWQALRQGRAATDEPLLQTLTLNDCALVMDRPTGCFLYSLIEDDPAAWDPPVRWQGAPGVRLAIRQARITPQSIADNAGIELLAYTDTAYRVYSLRCTTLPVLSLQFDPALQVPQKGDQESEGLDLYFFDNRANALRRVLTCKAGSHPRGATSLGFHQNSYRLTLYERSLGGNLREYNVPLLDLRADGDWLLYAAFNDQEKIRNVFSSNLWYTSCAQNNTFGIDNGMQYRYVELFRNGEYRGLYALGYPVDSTQLCLRGGDAKEAEPLFQKDSWAASEVAVDPGGQPFLYGYTLEAPDPGGTAAWQPLVDYYAALLYAQTPAALYAAADIDSAIDIGLFFDLIQASDSVAPGALKNLYIAFKRGSAGLQALYVPWDMDLTWGNVYSYDPANRLATDAYAIPAGQAFPMDLNPVWRLRELGDPAIDGLVRDRYAALRAGPWSEDALLGMLDGYAADIFDSGAFARDTARWPEGAHVDPAQRLDAFKAYVTARLRAMDGAVAALG